MAKPMLVTLPFVLLLLDWWPLKRLPFSPESSSAESSVGTDRGYGRVTISRAVAEKWPLFVLTSASCVVTYLAQRTEAVIELEGHPLPLRFATALTSYAAYLWKMIWPVDLSIIYPLAAGIEATRVWLSAVLLIGISLATWSLRREKPHLLTGWLWYLGTLVPVIGLVQVGGQAMADRYTYIPLLGIFLALAFEAAHWVERRKWPMTSRVLLAGIALAASASVTYWQLGYWRNTETLFARALAVTEQNAIAHVNYGMALEQEQRRDDALRHYAQAVEINPSLAQAHNNLANLLDATGKPEEALTHYQAALRLKPNAALTHANLGTLLSRLGRFGEAQYHFAQAMRLAPRDPRPHYLAGKARLRQGRAADAVASFRHALARDPNHVPTLLFAARILATAPDPSVRNGALARQLAEQANALTGESHPVVLDTLAAAYAEEGQFAKAAATVRQAIQAGPPGGKEQMIEAMQARLALFLSNQAYREQVTNVDSIMGQ
jgi:protein O-mannosyl-transferase